MCVVYQLSVDSITPLSVILIPSRREMAGNRRAQEGEDIHVVLSVMGVETKVSISLLFLAVEKDAASVEHEGSALDYIQQECCPKKFAVKRKSAEACCVTVPKVCTACTTDCASCL